MCSLARFFKPINHTLRILDIQFRGWRSRGLYSTDMALVLSMKAEFGTVQVGFSSCYTWFIHLDMSMRDILCDGSFMFGLPGWWEGGVNHSQTLPPWSCLYILAGVVQQRRLQDRTDEVKASREWFQAHKYVESKKDVCKDANFSISAWLDKLCKTPH